MAKWDFPRNAIFKKGFCNSIHSAFFQSIHFCSLYSICLSICCQKPLVRSTDTTRASPRFFYSSFSRIAARPSLSLGLFGEGVPSAGFAPIRVSLTDKQGQVSRCQSPPLRRPTSALLRVDFPVEAGLLPEQRQQQQQISHSLPSIVAMTMPVER